MAKGKIKKLPVIENGKLVGIVADVDILSVSSQMNSILADLIEMHVERDVMGIEDEGMEQGICEKCGTFSNYLEMKDGLMLCDSCKDEMESEE